MHGPLNERSVYRACDFNMATVAPGAHGGCTNNGGISGALKGIQRWDFALEMLVDDVWTLLLPVKAGQTRPDEGFPCKGSFVDELSFHAPATPFYTSPPPSYEDAVHDLPPDYAVLPPLAERKTVVFHPAPATPAKSRDQKSDLWKDDLLNTEIDFQSPLGVREHKKKKAGTNKKPVATNSTQPSGGGDDNAGEEPPPAEGDGGDGGDAGGGDGGDGGGGGGGDGGGDDDWNAWTTSGSKKTKKQKEEEEEQERLAKEEEERKAAEASAANNLSWAEDAGGGGDDSWAGFDNVGKKKKKGKVCLLVPHIYRYSFLYFHFY